jgi:uncharacterized delta-60 repeat protein
MMKLIQNTFAAVLLFTGSFTGFTQVPGTLDSTFALNGILTIELNDGFENINDMLLLEDDKILALGFTEQDNGNWETVVFRLHPDGALDNTFGENGYSIFSVSGDLDFPQALALQEDGKIIVAGGGLVSSSDIQIYAARLNADGSLDASFGENGIQLIDAIDGGEDLAYSVAIQPDGKIILAGQNQVEGFIFQDPIVLRLNSDGSLDESFGADGTGIVTIDGDDDYVAIRDLLLLDDGTMMATGYSANTKSDILTMKLLANGDLDPSYSDDGLAFFDLNNGSDDSYSILRHPLNGRILIGGRIGDGNNKTNFLVFSVNTDGTIDSTFGTNGLCIFNGLAQDAVTDMTVQLNGKIVVAGTAGGGGLGDNDWAVGRINEDGTVDSAFGESNGLTITEAGSFFSSAWAVGILSDGNILAAGVAANFNNDWCFIRYHGDDVATGISNHSPLAANSLSAYPNPSNGIFRLLLDHQSGVNETVSIEIINSLGQVVYHRAAFAPNGKLDEQIELNAALVSGVMRVNVRSQGKMMSLPVVITE